MSTRPLPRAIVLCALLTSLICPTVTAQTADLPSAPAGTAKPSQPPFSVPAEMSRPVVTSSGIPPAAPVEDEFCYAAVGGIYTNTPSKLPAPVQQALQRYFFIQMHNLEVAWGQHMPRSATDPWTKSTYVVARFAILPDGSIDPPLITSSSGHKSFDKHAVDTIQGATPFPPLPDGAGHPIPLCMRFGYNVDKARGENPRYTLNLWSSTDQPPQ